MFKLFSRDRNRSTAPNARERVREIASTKTRGEMKLHELDYEDVAITPEGARMVKSAARSVVEQYMPAVDSKKITVREAMALFIDHVFWEEKSGGLFMCTDVATRSVCLPLPSRCWTVRQPATPVQ